MSSDYPIIVVQSLDEFLQILDPKSFQMHEESFFRIDSDEPLWFRGHSEQDWALKPTLYRKVGQIADVRNFWDELRNAEEKTYEEFEVRNYHFLQVIQGFSPQA